MTDVRLTIEATTLPGRTCGPYTDVEVGLQVGKDVEHRVGGDASSATWALALTRTDDGDWRGPAVQGKRGERFVYLVWIGRERGGPTAMFRRAKLQLDAVDPEVAAGGTLVARLGLTDGQSMPLCASVRPPLIRWSAE